MEDLTGRQLGSYRIVEPLGESGMAAVYRAYHAGMDRDVALKVLPRQSAGNTEFVARFKQEVRVLALHRGFTDEEWDFIINYDIKYRMGREAGEEE